MARISLGSIFEAAFRNPLMGLLLTFTMSASGVEVTGCFLKQLRPYQTGGRAGDTVNCGMRIHLLLSACLFGFKAFTLLRTRPSEIIHLSTSWQQYYYIFKDDIGVVIGIIIVIWTIII